MSEAPHAIDTRLLTPYLRRLIATLGLDVTIRLLRAHGGTRIELPKRPAPHHQIVRILGIENARKLIAEFDKPFKTRDELRNLRGLTLPKADKILDQLRDAAICQSEDSTNVLALRYNLTRRQVQNIRANRGGWQRWRKPDSGQAD